MAYTDDAVLAKLSALNETQDSIVTVAQWIMFHRRHAERTGQLWFQRLKDSGSNKRLNLIYLANEVAQQSKARRKDDFLIAFSPFIADATATAYKGATSEVQAKLKRVVEVWRQRQIFELPIQQTIEIRIDELDKTRHGSKKGQGGSIFSSNTSSVPPELKSLVAPQQEISKLAPSNKATIDTAGQDYVKLTDKNTVPPTAPVYAARLNGLLKTLAGAEGAVAESIKARKALIEGLENLLESNRTALVTEEAELSTLSSRRAEIDAKKKDVEDGIMRGIASMSNPSTPVGAGSPGSIMTPSTPVQESIRRPDMEALTPPRPKVEELTPPHFKNEESPEAPVKSEPEPNNHFPSAQPAPVHGSDLLSSLLPHGHSASPSQYPMPKKRKLDGDDFPDLGGDAMDGLDDDVVASLRGDSGNGI